MPITREQLIADWRQKLAEGGEQLTDQPEQVTWLLRVRQRLLRFLLSLYGGGQWQSSTGLPEQQDASARDLVVSPVLTLHGKPAKPVETIRATLDSVAQARTVPVQRGVLGQVEGLEGWVVVAALSEGLDPDRCVGVLTGEKIATRAIRGQYDICVEVKRKNLIQARRILNASIGRLRVFTRPLEPTHNRVFDDWLFRRIDKVSKFTARWSFGLVGVAQLLLTFPLAYACVLIGVAIQPYSARSDFAFEEELGERFWLTWRGLFIIALLLIWLRAHWRDRRQANPGQLSTNSVAAK